MNLEETAAGDNGEVVGLSIHWRRGCVIAMGCVAAAIVVLPSLFCLSYGVDLKTCWLFVLWVVMTIVEDSWAWIVSFVPDWW